MKDTRGLPFILEGDIKDEIVGIGEEDLETGECIIGSKRGDEIGETKVTDYDRDSDTSS